MKECPNLRYKFLMRLVIVAIIVQVTPLLNDNFSIIYEFKNYKKKWKLSYLFVLMCSARVGCGWASAQPKLFSPIPSTNLPNWAFEQKILKKLNKLEHSFQYYRPYNNNNNNKLYSIYWASEERAASYIDKIYIHKFQLHTFSTRTNN